jgi:hypothetical protein
MWILPDQLSSRFVQASGCSMKPFALSSREVELRLSLSGKVTPRASYWRGWKTRPWSQRLFGAAISEDSTQRRFADWWTSSLRVCPASPTASPANNLDTPTTAAKEKTAPDPSRNSCESLSSVSPPWCSLKTFLPGFDTESNGFDPSEKLYAEWVTRSLSRSLSLRRQLERVTKGSGCSSSHIWPTVRANEGGGGDYQNQTDGTTQPTLTGSARHWPTAIAGNGGETGSRGNVRSGRQLHEEAMNWGTPRVTTNNGLTSPQCTGKGSRLEDQTAIWQTPATDAFRSRVGDRKNEQGLDQQARFWASPTSSDNSNRTTQRAPSHGLTHGEVLAGQAASWPSPRSEDSESCGNHPGAKYSLTGATLNWPTPNSNPEATFQSLPQVPAVSTNGEPLSPTRRTLRPRLNPAFVCWLMGMPSMWWTRAEPISCAAQETQLWRSRARRLLSTCFNPQKSPVDRIKLPCNLSMMFSTIIKSESPVLGGRAQLSSRPSRTGDFLFPRTGGHRPGFCAPMPAGNSESTVLKRNPGIRPSLLSIRPINGSG